jgi:D-alanyl-D-alanine carboxypeptidase
LNHKVFDLKIQLEKMNRKIFLWLFFMSSLIPVRSQELDKAKLDAFFNSLDLHKKAMGSIIISRAGQELYQKAIGYSLIAEEEKKEATETTKYRIGSISKMFTATLVFQLVEEGKLDLSTTVDVFFPKLPNASSITISNLLNHRSGWYNFTNDSDYLQWMTLPKSQEEMRAIIGAHPVDFKPDEKASYSNSNYVILGHIIEKSTGLTYAQNLQERITSKLELKNTYCGGKIQIDQNECYSYQLVDDWRILPETDMSIPGGAGAVVSTPRDMSHFIESLFAFRLISEKSLQQMQTITDGYGMGMFQFPFDSLKLFGHNGGIDGFASLLAYIPEDSLAIAYCTNGQVYPMNDILVGVLSIYYHKEYPIPSFEIFRLKTEELDAYIGVYTSDKFPLKITITKNETVLIAQADGQSSFPLEAVDKDAFVFDPAGIALDFNPRLHQMTLTQRGAVLLFTKER